MYEQKDFYYSRKQERALRNVVPRYIPPQTYVETRFKGRVITECVTHGRPAPDRFDDMEYVGTGTYQDCTYT